MDSLIITKEQNEIINGSLLGDAHIERRLHYSASYCIQVKRTDLNYLEWHYEKMKNLCKSGIKYNERFDKRTLKTYYSNKFKTKYNKIFNSYRNKWYPNGIKIIPNDLILTPTVIALWVYGDGSIRKRRGSFEINIATNGFTFQDVEMITSKLVQKFKENFYISKHCNMPVIYGSNYASRLLFKYIENIIPKHLNRKHIWKNKDLILTDVMHSHTFKQLNYKCLILKLLKDKKMRYKELLTVFSREFKVKNLSEYLRVMNKNNLINKAPNSEELNDKCYSITELGVLFLEKQSNNNLLVI